MFCRAARLDAGRGDSAADEAAQFFGQFEARRRQVAVRFSASLLGQIEQSAKVVATGEQGRDQGSADADLGVAQFVEHILHPVGEAFDHGQLDDARATLNGVRCAKDGVEGLGIVIPLLHAQQAGLHPFQLLPGFLDKNA